MTTTTPTVNDRATGLIRTYVGYGIGAVLAWVLVHTGLDLTGPFQAGLLVLVIALVTNLYYFVVRLLEVRFPFVGVLLGIPKTPEYQAVDNLWASFVRTAIPTLVSAVVVTFVVQVIDMSADQQATLIAIVTAAASSAYYTVARAIITRWPRTRVLLGTSAQPEYLPGGASA